METNAKPSKKIANVPGASQRWSAGTIASAVLTAILGLHFIQSVGMLVCAAAGVQASEVLRVLFVSWGFVMIWYLAELVLIVLGVFAVWAGIQQKTIARLSQRVFLIISITCVVIFFALMMFALAHITV